MDAEAQPSVADGGPILIVKDRRAFDEIHSRKCHITASRAAALLGFDHFLNKDKKGIEFGVDQKIENCAKAFRVLVGDEPRDKLNEFMAGHGHRWEAMHIALVSNWCGYLKYENNDDTKASVHPKYPFITATPDAYFGSDSLIEVKSPARAQVTEIGTGYHVQVQLQLACSGRKRVYFCAASLRYSHAKLWIIERDEAFIEWMITWLVHIATCAAAVVLRRLDPYVEDDPTAFQEYTVLSTRFPDALRPDHPTEPDYQGMFAGTWPYDPTRPFPRPSMPVAELVRDEKDYVDYLDRSDIGTEWGHGPPRFRETMGMWPAYLMNDERIGLYEDPAVYKTTEYMPLKPPANPKQPTKGRAPKKPRVSSH